MVRPTAQNPADDKDGMRDFSPETVGRRRQDGFKFAHEMLRPAFENRRRAEAVANAGKAVTMFAQKLKSRCALLMGQDANEERRKRERLPCNLKIEIQTLRGPITAAVYEISMQGVLISGRWSPGHASNGASLCFKGIGEKVCANVDDCRWFGCVREIGHAFLL